MSQLIIIIHSTWGPRRTFKSFSWSEYSGTHSMSTIHPCNTDATCTEMASKGLLGAIEGTGCLKLYMDRARLVAGPPLMGPRKHGFSVTVSVCRTILFLRCGQSQPCCHSDKLWRSVISCGTRVDFNGTLNWYIQMMWLTRSSFFLTDLYSIFFISIYHPDLLG